MSVGHGGTVSLISVFISYIHIYLTCKKILGLAKRLIIIINTREALYLLPTICIKLEVLTSFDLHC